LTISFFPFIPVKLFFTAKGIDRRKFTKTYETFESDRYAITWNRTVIPGGHSNIKAIQSVSGVSLVD